MRWVLIRPRNRSPYFDPEIQEPLGIECLAAVRAAVGDAVLVLDVALTGGSEEKLARRAAAFEPDAVGFSVMTAQEVPSVTALHAGILEAAGGRPIRFLAGGNLVSTEPETAARLLPAGMLLVAGDGEVALGELAERAAAGDEWGLGETGGGFVRGAPAPDLDALPFPWRPFASRIIGAGWAFNLQGSRGCCGACRHCASPGMTAAGAGGRWRGRSPERIVDEMERLHRSFGTSSFNFVDEDFLGPNAAAGRRAHEFARELRERGLDVAFGIQVRPDSLSDAIVDELTEAGLVYVFVGVESDDPEDFRRWNRPFSPDPFSLVDRLRERGAEVNAGVMLFHSHSTFPKLRRFARTLTEHDLLEYRSAINRQDAMPGSRLHAECVEAGVIDPLVTGPQHVPFVEPGIEEFRADLLTALGPLGPPSMSALCALPPLLARRRREPESGERCERLQATLRFLDGASAETFFAVLDLHEAGEAAPDRVAALQADALEVAEEGIRRLVADGFARSYDDLREAVRMDAGV